MGALPLAILASLIWGSAFAAAKFGLADCPPLLFLVTRFLVAGAIMLGWAALRGIRTSQRELAMLAGLGVINFATYLGLTNLALAHVPSAIVAAVIGVNPVCTVAAGAVLLGETPTPRARVALALGLAGVAVVTLPRVLDAPPGAAGGYAMALGGLAALSLGTVLFRRFGTRAEPVLANAVQSLGAGLALIPASALSERWGDLALSPAFLASQAWLIGIVSIVGYMLWFRMLRSGSLAAAAVVQFTLPPLGLAYGALLHGETLTVTDIAGLAPILCALVVINRR
ncbi:DMT family transporter [Elioraea sp.]|uniref:DMT family transporter n=1 Tax=Elioraea sp. TaxID=2185103 RepID=UPI0025BD9A94|nr:EamA family transporter [Elioraea sp.]